MIHQRQLCSAPQSDGAPPLGSETASCARRLDARRSMASLSLLFSVANRVRTGSRRIVFIKLVLESLYLSRSSARLRSLTDYLVRRLPGMRAPRAAASLRPVATACPMSARAPARLVILTALLVRARKSPLRTVWTSVRLLTASRTEEASLCSESWTRERTVPVRPMRAARPARCR